MEMFLILVFFTFGAQFALMAWKQYHPKSYHLLTLLGMWIVPMCYSSYMLYFRFMTVWLSFSLVTGVMVYLSSCPRISTSTPRYFLSTSPCLNLFLIYPAYLMFQGAYIGGFYLSIKYLMLGRWAGTFLYSFHCSFPHSSTPVLPFPLVD